MQKVPIPPNEDCSKSIQRFRFY